MPMSRLVDVETCDEEGCERDVYPGWSRCLGCGRKLRRAA